MTSLETPEELTNAMRQHSAEEALSSLTQWLDHRDQVADQLASDDLATALDTLAADMQPPRQSRTRASAHQA